MPIVYLGSKTGRDGIHGATMASAEFGADAEGKRPTVQVGDPFSEKLLLEACLEIMAKGCVIAIQDMGAAGLTCSAVEMGAKGDVCVTLHLDCVPCPASKGDERVRDAACPIARPAECMLMASSWKAKAPGGAGGFPRKWSLDFAVIGYRPLTSASLRWGHRGDVMVDLPTESELGRSGAGLRTPVRGKPR